LRRGQGLTKKIAKQPHAKEKVSTCCGARTLVAATALTNGLTMVTRNDRDVAVVFNPFKGAENNR